MDESEEGEYAVVNGLKLHYVQWGSPASVPIVMLHGLRAYACWFAEFAEAASDRYHLIAFDQRGRGASDWAADGDYSRDAYVADLEGLVGHLRLNRFILLGHSMGALTVMHYAARHPGRVVALVDVDVGPEIPPAGMERIRRELRETPEHFGSWTEATAFLQERHPGASTANRDTRARWMFKEAGDGAVEWRLDPAIFDPNIQHDAPEQTRALLGKLRCPTLIVRGGLSDILTAESCDEMVGLIPDGCWVEIPDASHMVLKDNPAAFNAAVLEFLRESASHIL